MSNLLSKASILLTPTAYSDGTLHSVKPIQTFGSELVVNGDFATDSNWNVNAGWSISDGKANIDTDNGTLNFAQTGVLVVGKKYKLSLIANATVGRIKFESGEGDNLIFTSNIDSHIFTADNTQVIFRRQVVPTRGYIDNVSIVEVTDGDFDFTRATTATRVNSSGLIESVASGLPRIDFTGGTGQILLEPSSTNTATYSNDFTQGDIFSGSNSPSLTDTILTANQGTAPDGTNTAFLLKDNDDGGSGQTGLSYFNTFVNANDFNTFSVFVKKSLSNNFIYLSSGGYDTAASGQSYFNIQDGTLGTVSSKHTAKIEDYGSGWYRCQITNKTVTDLQGSYNVRLATSDNTVNITRDGTNGVLLFGLQTEADASRNFATSYIPTSGSTVTRNKDQANNSGDSSLINSTEGVLYAEFSCLGLQNSSFLRLVSLNDGTSSEDNTVFIYQSNNTNNQIVFVLTASSSNVIGSAQSVSDITAFNKVAFLYKSGGSKIFINGSLVHTSTASFSLGTLNNLGLSKSTGSSGIEGKVKCVAVFKEALTDAQLISLTS